MSGILIIRHATKQSGLISLRLASKPYHDVYCWILSVSLVSNYAVIFCFTCLRLDPHVMFATCGLTLQYKEQRNTGMYCTCMLDDVQQENL